MINKLLEEFKKIEEIEAIAIGGSRATNNYDQKSDYDIYLYTTDNISIDVRRNILSKYCKYMEIGNAFWELEDNCTLRDGIDIDILYRNLDDFTAGLSSVVEKYNARNGYTTCMWHNLLTCKIIYDKNGRLNEIKKRFNIKYPEQLRNNIIKRNINLLYNTLPCYSLQIAKALNRNDIISINHRTTAFMESYFDIIFAINEMTHPGEKRLIDIAKKECKILPNNFEENINELFRNLYHNYNKVKEVLNDIIEELVKII